MQKYLRIFEVTIKQYFVYRLSFVLWRLRMFINLIIVFFLWSAVFVHNQQVAGYDKASLLTYILFVNIISTLVMGTRTSDIANQINDGSVMNYLLKPFSFFKYYASQDVADKLLNVAFVFVEFAIIVLLFNPPIQMPQNILLGLTFLVAGLMISFFINMMLSFVAFWTTETWAPRFLYIMLIGFVSGSFFPLDLMPIGFYNFLLTTPFPYLFYFPTKIVLGFKDPQLYLHLAISYLWVFLTWKLAKYMWNRGNRSFSFWGK